MWSKCVRQVLINTLNIVSVSRRDWETKKGLMCPFLFLDYQEGCKARILRILRPFIRMTEQYG